MELIIIPIIAGLIAAFTGKWSKWVALLGSLAGLAIVALWLQKFNPDGTFNFVQSRPWFGNGIWFKTGADGISMLLLLLTNIVCPLILIVASNKSNEDKSSLFGLIVGMQGALNGVFLAMDGMMFYIFWELALIPIYFICALWGEGNRFKTTLKFFIYTFIGSLAMLCSLIFLYSKMPDGTATFDIQALQNVNLTQTQAIWVGLGILLAFAVKIPLLPLHSWQSDTYTEAPTSGSMLLSAIMLKMGLYGLIRWFFPLVPEAYHIYAPIIMVAAVAGVLYGAIIAIRQQDMKRLIAFSSLSHVGLIAAGIATLSYTGMQGALIQMFNHGINVLGLFLAVDVIQQRAGTRDLGQLGGIAKQAPLFAVAFMIVMLATSAVPFTNGFPGELLLLKGIFTANAVWGVFAGLTIILCAVYMFRMYQFSMFGTEKNGVYLFPDLTMREILVFGVLVVLIIGIGVFPQWMLDLTGPSVKKTLEIIENTVGVIA